MHGRHLANLVHSYLTLRTVTFFNTGCYGSTAYYFDHENARFFVLNNDIVDASCIENQQAYYAFDEGGGTIATDLIDANHGTIFGATGTTTAKWGWAFAFDGNDYVTRANPSSALKPASQVTISAWINPTALDSSGSEVVSMGDSYALRVKTDGSILFFYFDGTTWRPVTTTGVDVRVGEWHHIVGQKTSSALQIYVDGVLRGSVNNTGTITYNKGPDFFIGKHGNGGTTYDFTGSIDDVRVYNRALNAQEVALLFNPEHELGNGLGGNIDQVKWLREMNLLKAKPMNFIMHHEPAYGTGAHDLPGTNTCRYGLEESQEK